MWNQKIVRNREGYAGQLMSLAGMLKGATRELDAGIFTDDHLEKRIKSQLRKSGVRMLSVVFYMTAQGKYEIHLTVKACLLYTSVMEKTGWKTRLGDNMINAYSAVRPISDVEMEYLRNRLSYPEKIWKIANSYYHSNKAWVSVKNIEKLSTAIRQTEEKRRFLEEIFSFHL